MKKAICKKCGQQFTKQGNAQKYCLLCKASVRRQQLKQASAKYYSKPENALKQMARAKTEYAI